MNKEFELNGHEYVQLDKLLKLLALVATGGEAHARVSNREVMVNGAVEIQKRKKIRVGDKVLFQDTAIIIK